MFKWWEKIDQWLFLVLGVILSVIGLKLTIAFVLWAEQAVNGHRILRWIFGWLF